MIIPFQLKMQLRLHSEFHLNLYKEFQLKLYKDFVEYLVCGLLQIREVGQTATGPSVTWTSAQLVLYLLILVLQFYRAGSAGSSQAPAVASLR